jgi:general secretion pathway protein A
MYLSYYNLTAKPFQISADPKFLWLGEKHKEALATLRYGVWDNKGFLLLTGDVGTGKTTLINALVNNIGGKVIVATVPDPGLEKMDFFNYIANAFKIKKVFQSKGSFLIYFKYFLLHVYKKKGKVLLIIDEAQRLNQELLEEIRLLSNIEKQETKLITICFVGQNEFNDVLLEQRNRAIRQRIALNYNIDPLTERETGEYIKHRLKVSGSKKNIFTSDAIQEIFSYSEGFPREINIICDRALLTGYLQEKKKINSKIIKECAVELRIPAKISNKPEIRKDALVGIRHEALEVISKKNKVKTAGYIAVLILFLIMGGYFYSPTGFNQYIENMEQIFNPVVSNIKNSRSDTLPPTKDINNANSAGKDLIRSSDQTLQGEVATSPMHEAPKTQENGDLNIKLSPKEIKDLTILKDRNFDNHFGESIPDDIAIQDQKLIIYFGYNSNEIPKDDYKTLDQLAAFLIQNPDVSIIIKGYTDNIGRYLYNKKLSEFRALIVKSYLVAKGINSQKIESFGMGPVSKLENKEFAKEIKSNRYVEIELIK